ncbi:MAG: YbhB/YbcL family Raf kinase inhibitor-like protein [bacterium]
MNIESTSFSAREKIPEKFTCDGAGTNPGLRFSSVPTAAKSLAIIMDDPDSPSGVYTHWTLWNLPKNTNQISEGRLPPGIVQGLTSAGSVGYFGPCPGSGTHRYFFHLYALDAMLELTEGSDVDELHEAIQGHILETAEMYGTYVRK